MAGRQGGSGPPKARSSLLLPRSTAACIGCHPWRSGSLPPPPASPASWLAGRADPAPPGPDLASSRPDIRCRVAVPAFLGCSTLTHLRLGLLVRLHCGVGCFALGTTAAVRRATLPHMAWHARASASPLTVAVLMSWPQLPCYGLSPVAGPVWLWDLGVSLDAWCFGQKLCPVLAGRTTVTPCAPHTSLEVLLNPHAPATTAPHQILGISSALEASKASDDGV